MTAASLVLLCQKLHDMRNAMRQLLDAVRADICFRTSDCQEQIQFVLDRSKQLNQIEDAMVANRFRAV
ncbi:MAG: hypothetical protein V8R46_05630 [Eubacterium ramulus]